MGCWLRNLLIAIFAIAITERTERNVKKLYLTVLLFGASVHADILQVPSQYKTIQLAIDAAVAGDSVHIDSGTYYEKIDLLGKAIQVIGIDGPETTTIDATGLDGSVIYCSNNEGPETVISGLTLTGGTGTLHPIWKTFQGGGIFAFFASPTVTNCVVIGNQAEFAGGMWAQEYSSTIENVRFENNHATYPITGGAGGLYLWNSSALVTGCTFENNDSVGAGGAMRSKISASSDAGNSIIRNCTFNSNQAGQFGGAVATNRATPTFDQCTFTNNTATEFAGAFNVGGILTDNILVHFESCTFSNNSAGGYGGALRVSQAGAIFEKCEFSSNSAPLYGGAIAVIGVDSFATCSFSGCAIRDNNSGQGGAIYHLEIASSDIDSTVICGNGPNPIVGEWVDLGGNTLEASCTSFCGGDIDASGFVNVTDILELIADFGPCNGIDSCFSDLNGDGVVNVTDILILIGNWGECQ